MRSTAFHRGGAFPITDGGLGTPHDQQIPNPLCLPMPPDHEYEIPMFSRDVLGGRLHETGLMMIDTVSHAPASDPFYALTSEEDDTTMNDLFPPSLQELLESAYSSMYEEALLLEEQEVPYDIHKLNILDSNDGDSPEQLESLDVLGEVEMTSSPAPASPTHCASLKLSSKSRQQMQDRQSSLSSADGTEHEEGQSASACEGNTTASIKRRKVLKNTVERKVKKDSHPNGHGRDSFIENKCIRKRRFIDGLQTLITKIKHIRSRTGASGEFVAVFEGQEYSIENVQYESSLRARKARKTIKTKLTLLETMGSDELEDDHRYAATLLTQKLSSPNVRDHQYNEAISSCPGSQAKDSSNFREHVYIQLQYQRDRTFEQFLKSTFSRVKILEVRTAAMVDINFDYEGCKFTRENCNEVNSILQKKRNRRNIVEHVNVAVEHLQRADGTKLCRIFNRPCSTVNAAGVTNGSRIPSQQASVSRRYTSTSEVESILETIEPTVKLITTGVHSELTEPSKISSNLQDPQANWNAGKLLVESVPNPRGISESSTYSETISEGVRTDEHRSPSPILAKDSTDTETEDHGNGNMGAGSKSTILNLPHATGQNILQNDLSACPESEARTAVNTNNGTNPICAKCQYYFPRNSEMRRDGFVPWIRCFDPFCQYLVHASCIGFFVTSRRDLKRLPPYYCEAHRDDM